MFSSFGRDILTGVNRYNRAHGGWTIYGDPERIVAPIDDLRRWAGDGVIAQVWRADIHALMDRVEFPVVNVSQHMAESVLTSVLADSRTVGQLAAQHLLGRGFTQFAFCGFVGHRYSELRADAFDAEVARHGFPCVRFDTEPPQVEPERWDERLTALANWVRRLPRPIGVMCCNDVRARHVAQACTEAGVRVPEEMALVGADDDVLICEMSTPPLSSVDVNAAQVGYEAAALLDRLMNGEAPPTGPALVPPVGVVTRRSSDVLAVADPVVVDAMRFIHENASRPIGVNDVVDAVPASRRVLERRFKAALGRTVGEQIGQARIDRAKQLLVASDVPTPHVAAKSGFNYVQQFNTMFKRVTGMTPIAYRRQYRLR